MSKESEKCEIEQFSRPLFSFVQSPHINPDQVDGAFGVAA